MSAEFPPPIPGTGGGRWFRICAQLSWILPLVFTGVALAVCIFRGWEHSETPRLAGGLAAMGFVTGIGCGIIGLVGVTLKKTSRGLMASIVGLILCVSLVVISILAAIAVPAALKARERAMQARVQRPAGGLRAPVFNAGKERVGDPGLAFSFELPEGFEVLPQDAALARYKYSYFKPTENDKPTPVILVQDLKTVLLPRHMTADQLPKSKDVTLLSFDWRGLAVDAVRVPEKIGDVSYVTFNTRIPLKKGGIQIGFGDAEANEAALRTRVETTLATLDGETNW